MTLLQSVRVLCQMIIISAKPFAIDLKTTACIIHSTFAVQNISHTSQIQPQVNIFFQKLILSNIKPDNLTAFKETLLTTPEDIKTGLAWMSPKNGRITWPAVTKKFHAAPLLLLSESQQMSLQLKKCFTTMTLANVSEEGG